MIRRGKFAEIYLTTWGIKLLITLMVTLACVVLTVILCGRYLWDYFNVP